MDAFDKYYLFDHDGNKMFSVTPHLKMDGIYCWIKTYKIQWSTLVLR